MLFAYRKNNDHVDLEVIINPEIFHKISPKDAFSTMIDSLTPKHTILTSQFAACNVEEFHTAYRNAAKKESFLKTYTTASREKPSINDQVEDIFDDVMTSHRFGLVDTNLGNR